MWLIAQGGTGCVGGPSLLIFARPVNVECVFPPSAVHSVKHCHKTHHWWEKANYTENSVRLEASEINIEQINASW